MREKLLTLLLVCCAAVFAVGCGGGSGSSASPTFSATPEQRPELTLDTVRKAINGSWVENVPAADGKGKPENWKFFYNEPKEIEIVEQKLEGDRATVVVNLKTRSGPRDPNQRSLEGQLRLHLELRNDFIFREWDVEEVDNISLKYTRLQPLSPPAGVPQGSPPPGVSPNDSQQGPPPPPPPPLPPRG